MSHDHHINLKQATFPWTIMPYRYLYYQKTIIEKILEDLLESGVIQPSQLSFPYPILLVRKSDGTWWICIDYKAWNDAKFKDKYHIPMEDKVLASLV